MQIQIYQDYYINNNSQIWREKSVREELTAGS